MNFPNNAYKYLSQDEKDYFQDKNKASLQARWKTKEGIEFRRKIIEINFAGGSYRNYLPYLGYVKSSFFPQELLIDLRGFDLSSYSNLFDEKIVSLDFSFCDLSYATFENSELSTCKFNNSNLQEVNFSSSLLDECNFSHANLNTCDFSFSELESADIRSSCISNSIFKETNLHALRFNKKVDFNALDMHMCEKMNNYKFLTFLNKKAILKEKGKKSLFFKLLYFFWIKIF